MTEPKSALSRQDLEAKIVKRCWENEEFRKEFLADPSASIVKHLALPVVSLPKIVIHQEGPGSWHIVLPAKPANANELSEEDLEKVAGGATPTLVTLVTATISAAVSGSAGSVSASASLTLNQGW
jgi:hypothetical protein